MSMTIKALADELGVSKTAIRKWMTPEFRKQYTETTATGVILVSDAGANLLRMKRKSVEKTRELCSETVDSTVSTPPADPAVAALIEQLQAKDRQIEAQQAQIDRLTAALENAMATAQAAQALHAGTLQLTAGKEVTAAEETTPRRWRWPWQ